MNKNMNNKLEIISGKFPVLVTAPHAYGVSRKNLSGSLRAAEVNTDLIARELCNHLSCSGIVSTGVLEYDPNFDIQSDSKESNPFKASLLEVASSNNIQCLIDIHGLSDSHQYDFAIYYPIRFRKSRQLAFDVAKGVSKDLLRDSVIQVLNFNEDGRESLSQYFLKQIGMPAIQIEISRYIREDKALREQFVKNISKVLSKL